MDIIKKIFIFLFFLFIFCCLPLPAEAGNLIVDFSPDPLFASADFSPGNSVSGLVKVTNTSGQTQKVVAEADNIIDSNNFSSYLNLIIKQDEKILFNDSLKNFFIAKEIFLSELENEFSAIYEFVITFDSSAPSELQGKSLENFDLLVGFLGQEKIVVAQSSSGANLGGVYEEKEIEKTESEKIEGIKDNSEQANPVNLVNPVNPVNPVNLRLNQGQVAGQSDIEQQQPEQIAEEQEQLREQPQEQKQEQKNSATEIYFITGFIFLFLAIIYLIKIIKNRTRKNN